MLDYESVLILGACGLAGFSLPPVAIRVMASLEAFRWMVGFSGRHR